MGILDKFKVSEEQNHNYLNARTKENLNFNYDKTTDAAKKMRDKLEQEYPGKYEMSVAVKTSIGWRSGKFVPTNQPYLYIYSLDIYDNVLEKNKKYLESGLVYDEIRFFIREKDRPKKKKKKVK